MKRELLDTDWLMTLSRLFRYPERRPEDADLRLVAADGQTAPGGLGPEDLESLQAAYVRLFINALPEVPCPPYGSFYLEGALMGETTVRLGRLYAQYGFQAEELADHIAVELEFLALLTALDSEPAVQQDYDFLLDHLRQWTPAFFKQVEENDALGFYRAVAAQARNALLISSI